MDRRAIALIVSLPCLAGCPWAREPVVPIVVDAHEPTPVADADGLLVLLPGIYDVPEDFRRQGALDDLARVAPRFNATMVDAHIGYYHGDDDNVVERLRDDVILPARRRGYQQVWLAGISLGGFGSLFYASQHPEHIDGVIAIAPYLGPDDLTHEVSAAGGLASWEPDDPATYEGEARFFRQLWAWLDGYAEHEHRPPLFLGYGADDRFAPTNAILAAALPRGRVVVVEGGGHNWATWTPLIADIVGRALASDEETPPRPDRSSG